MTTNFTTYQERATQLGFTDNEKMEKYDLVIKAWLCNYPLETKFSESATLYLVCKDFDKCLKYVMKKITKFP